jgi:hypothetical protein
MLFPDDLDAARRHAALRQAGPREEYERDGHGLAPMRLEHLSALSEAFINRTDIAKRKYAGTMVGETLKTLWALICSYPRFASWASAIKIVENTAGRKRGSRSDIKHELARFAPVLHL